MARDYKINISVKGGDRRGAFGGGNLVRNKSTLNSRMYKNQDNGNSISSGNLKKIFSAGMAFNVAQKGNEIFGAYTENRLRQRKTNVQMTYAKYGLGIAINAPIGLAYAGSDLAYRGIMYGIKINKKNREARFYRNLSGNNANSGRRYGGEYS